MSAAEEIFTYTQSQRERERQGEGAEKEEQDRSPVDGGLKSGDDRKEHPVAIIKTINKPEK